jgi:hypothetical protein
MNFIFFEKSEKIQKYIKIKNNANDCNQHHNKSDISRPIQKLVPLSVPHRACRRHHHF